VHKSKDFMSTPNQFVLILSITAVLCFAACDSNTNRIIGKWKYVNAPERINLSEEYFKGGRFLFVATYSGKTQTEIGTYHIDGDTIRTFVQGKHIARHLEFLGPNSMVVGSFVFEKID